MMPPVNDDSLEHSNGIVKLLFAYLTLYIKINNGRILIFSSLNPSSKICASTKAPFKRNMKKKLKSRLQISVNM